MLLFFLFFLFSCVSTSLLFLCAHKIAFLMVGCDAWMKENTEKEREKGVSDNRLKHSISIPHPIIPPPPPVPPSPCFHEQVYISSWPICPSSLYFSSPHPSSPSSLPTVVDFLSPLLFSPPFFLSYRRFRFPTKRQAASDPLSLLSCSIFRYPHSFRVIFHSPHYNSMASHSRSHRPPHPHPISLTSTLLSTLLLLPALLFLTTFTDAQATTYYTPTPVTGAAYARTGTHLFVLGGNPTSAVNSTPTDQFMALDLSVAWPTTAPAWTQLQPGPKQSKFPAVFSKDFLTFYAFHIPAATSPPISSMFQYSVKTGKWTAMQGSSISGDVGGVGAITNPLTGEIICAGGCTEGGQGKVQIWDLSKPTLVTTYEFPSPTLPLPATGPAGVFQSRSYYANVWCEAAKSVLYFGGYAPVRPDSMVTVLDGTSYALTTMVSSWPGKRLQEGNEYERSGILTSFPPLFCLLMH